VTPRRCFFLKLLGLAGGAAALAGYQRNEHDITVLDNKSWACMPGDYGTKRAAWGEARVRIGRARHVRIHVAEQSERYPRVFNVDTGEELSGRIRVEWTQKLKNCCPGQRVRFTAFLLNDKNEFYMSGDDLAREVLFARVVSVYDTLPGTERGKQLPRGGRVDTLLGLPVTKA
jgi:hypothetical protein